MSQDSGGYFEMQDGWCNPLSLVPCFTLTERQRVRLPVNGYFIKLNIYLTPSLE